MLCGMTTEGYKASRALKPADSTGTEYKVVSRDREEREINLTDGMVSTRIFKGTRGVRVNLLKSTSSKEEYVAMEMKV